MVLRISFLLGVSLILLSTAISQSLPHFRWFGDVRIRSEVDMRDFNLRTPANSYTLLRARLGVEALPVEDVRVLLQVRDSRVFGQERDAASFSTLADSRNLDLHQAFVEVKNVVAEGFSLKVGRMEWSYGNERLIGAVGWHNVGRTFDGAVLRIARPSFSADFFGATLAEVQSYAPVATLTAVQSISDRGASLFGVYSTFESTTDLRMDAYVLYHWDRNQTVPANADLQRYTVGSYAKGKLSAFEYEAEVAYQTGARRGTDISAYLLAVGAGYSLDRSPLSRLGIGYEMLSGTAETSTTYNSFDSPFHTGHKFYGFMDYFIAIPTNTNNRGLVDLLARATFSFSPTLTLNVWVHHFTLAESDKGQKTLGQEFDLVAFYRHSKPLSFEAGVSAFVPAPVMRARFSGADTAWWGYVAMFASF